MSRNKKTKYKNYEERNESKKATKCQEMKRKQKFKNLLKQKMKKEYR